VLSALVALPPGAASAQSEAPAGGQAAHGAAHGGAPNVAGARGAAGVGRVEFPVAAAPAARAEFARGVALLHSFLYSEARAAFRRARALDSSAVLAASFEALAWTYPVWNVQDTAAARAALRTVAPTREARLARARTARERAWMDAVEALYDERVPAKAPRDTAFSRAVAALHAADARDPEAAAFYAVSLLGLNQGVREPAAYARAEAVADAVLRAHPRHPGALHYKIHAVDDPANAARGMAAARLYGDVAPAVHHARHMTSHIYIARGMWDDVVDANRRAVALAPRFSAHYLHWLVYGLVQQGRAAEARAWVDSAAAFAREPGAAPGRATLPVLLGATWVVDAEAWDDPLARQRPDPARLGGARMLAEFVRGYAAARRAARPVDVVPGSRAADRAAADSVLALLGARRAALRAEATGAVGDADRARTLGDLAAWSALLRAELLAGAGRPDSAVLTLRAAAADWEAQPFDFGPPAVLVPPRERAAQLLLYALDRPADALAQADSAERTTPGRTQLRLVRARALDTVGRRDEARRAYAALDSTFHAAEPTFPRAADARLGAGRVPAPVRAARAAADTVTYAAAGPGAPAGLRGALWRPTAPGRHPGLVVVHGSGRCWGTGQVEDLGRRFAARGYVAFFPCRRGMGLSAGRGEAMADQMRREGIAGARDTAYARRSTELLETTQLADVRGAVAALRARPDVDPARVAVTGVSYGGILTLLAAEADSTLRAAVAFAPAAMNWSWNAPLRERLLAGARRTRVPTLVLQASNDWSVGPTEAIPAAVRAGGAEARGRLYPAVGYNANDGHGLMILAPQVWEPELYAFLDRHLARRVAGAAGATSTGARP
jgi:dienelactone hydrolase